jgi:hypothetical protein
MSIINTFKKGGQFLEKYLGTLVSVINQLTTVSHLLFSAGKTYQDAHHFILEVLNQAKRNIIN